MIYKSVIPAFLWHAQLLSAIEDISREKIKDHDC